MPKAMKGKLTVSTKNITSSGYTMQGGATPITKAYKVRTGSVDMNPSKRTKTDRKGKRVF